MFKLKPLKPVLLAIGFKLFSSLEAIACGTFKRIYALKGIAVGNFRTPHVLRSVALLLLLITPVASAFLLIAQPAVANATTSSYLNFQARLETSSGAIVPDGNYNVEFKLYNTSTVTGTPDQGACTYNGGTADPNCLWVETRTGANQVRVANGYLTVNLGSVNAFGSINWSQQLYLTMRIGGTGAPSWDAEMSPRITLTAVPYAFQSQSATQLQATVAGNLGQLTFDSGMTGGGQLFILPDQGAGGTYHVLTQEKANTGFIQLQGSTPGSVQTGNFNISGAGGGIGILNTLQSASAAAGTTLTVQGGAATSGTNTGGTLLLQGGAGASTGASGSVIVKANTHDSTTAFQVQNAAGTSTLLNADTTNLKVTVNGDIVNLFNSAPGLVQVSSITTTATNPIWVTVQGKYAYVVEQGGTATLQVLDVTNVSAPVSVGSLALSATTPNQVQVQGRYAYIAEQGASNAGILQIVDISNPHSPVSVSTISTGTSPGPFGVFIAGEYAYVVNSNTSTLSIINVSNPVVPVISSTISTGTNTSPRKVYVQGRYAYVIGGNTTSPQLQIFDVSNPASPSITGSVALGQAGMGISVQGRYAYITELTSSGQIEVMDVSNPAAPALLYVTSGSVDAESWGNVLAGRYLFTDSATNGVAGIAVHDISSPAAPSIIQTYTTSLNDPRGMFMDGRYLFVANRGAGKLTILDMSGLETTSATIHSLEAGNLLVDTNATISNNLTVGGGLNVGAGGIFSAGDLAVNGKGTFVSSTNSATAFQVQNSTGANLLTVDTANTAVVLGNDGTTSAITVRGGAASTSNTQGSNITFDASNGTGTGGSGDFIFRTAASTGTVTQDAVSNSNNAGSASPITWSHTVANQNNRILIVGLATSSSVTWTGVTWNGTQSFTHLGSSVVCPTVDLPGTTCRVDLWYLLAPAVGTHTISATSSAAANSSGGAVSYYNVDQTTPFGTVTTATGSTTGAQNISDSVTTTSTNQIALGVLGTNNAATNGSGTALWNDSFAIYSLGASKPGTGGSVAVNFSVNNGDWGIIGVPINPAANTTADMLQDRFHITAAGNIGIDTASPQYTLDVAGTGNFTTAVQTPQLQSATGTNLTVAAGSSLIFSTSGVTRATFDTANNLYLGNGVTAATPNNFVIQGTGSTTSAVAGGSLTLQGGNAAVGNASGGNVTLSGGTGIGTGVNGIVIIATPTFQTAVTQNCGTSCNVTQSSVDSNAAVVINATAASLTVTLPSPSNTTPGKIMYVTAANGSTDFTLSASGNTVTMHQNTTATMIWSGSTWTAAGASNATTLQATYNNGTNPSTTPEIKLDSTPHGTIDIQNDDANTVQDIFDIHAGLAGNLGTVLFGVSSTGRVTVQNVSDPTSAFRVLDASGNYVFNSNPSAGYTTDNNTRPIGNGIQNPSFESGGNITGGEEGWIGSSQASIVNSSANAHTGNYELQITANGVTQNVYDGGYYNVEPGDVIYLEGWVKNSAGANGSGSPVGVLIEGYDKAKAFVGSASNGNTLPGTSYVLRSVTYTVPSGVQYVRIAATIPAASTTGTFYFDDFYMHSSQRAAAVFQNSADSTAAFQIQSAGASRTLFTANTSSNIIKIGDSTGTNNPTIFQVDAVSSSNPSVSSSLNGGLWYNTSTNQLEAVVGGSIHDICVSSTSCTGYAASSSSSVSLQTLGSEPGTPQSGFLDIQGVGYMTGVLTVSKTAASTNSDSITIQTGDATGTNGITGSLTLDTGHNFGTGGHSGSITIGHSGVTTTMPGNLIIQGSTSLTLGTAGSALGSIALYSSSNTNGGNAVTIRANGGDPSSPWNLTLPQNPGSSGDCLKATSGTGDLGFSNCTSGATTTLQDTYNNSSSPATITLADAKDIKIVAQDTTTDPSIVFNLQCVTSCGTTGGRFAVQNGGTDVLVVKPNSGGIVLGANTQIGSATTDATQVNFQLDSYNGTSDSGTCTTTTNQGALYYNTTMGSIRGCVNGSWSDISNPDTLGLLTFGIVPSSGTTPYDLPALVTPGVSGPCKVSWASATSVSIQSCVAYSGGRRVNVTATTLSTNSAVVPNTNLTLTNNWGQICLTGTNSQPAFTSTTGSSSSTANMPTFNVAAPILCLASVKGVTSGTAGTIASLYDVRTFTSTIKEAVNITTAAVDLGMMVDSATGGLVASASCTSGTCSGKLYGIIVASDGSTSTGTPNAIVATVGSAWVKMTAGNSGEFIHSGPTAGYGVTVSSIPNNAFYYSAGNARTAFSTACTAADNCAGSVYVNMLVR